jgi:hypothetical protein
MAGVERIEHAIRLVVDSVLEGIGCPPTDLGALCTRLNVREVVDDDDIPVVGELRREGGAFRILCAVGQSHVQRRFTIAHELAHVLFENSGPRAPRVGAELERLCDMLAAEMLMPHAVFEGALEDSRPDPSGVRRLARQFQTSLTATVLRCSEFRPLSVICVRNGRRRWSRGPARIGDYRLKALMKHLVEGEPGDDLIAIDRGASAKYCRGQWIRTTDKHSGLVLLTPVLLTRSGS